jgi:hypothetical protein
VNALCTATPPQLHATAATWSLQAALAELEAAAKAAIDAAVDGNRGDRDIPLGSQQFGRRHALGGHSDPTADLALGAWAPGGPNPDAALLGDLLRQLDHMAAHVPGAPGTDPLTRIRRAIPGMRPHVAARTTEALNHLDRIARKQLGIGPALAPLPGNPACPNCRLQMLQQHTADPARPIVCTACGDIWTAEHFAARSAA